jgi:dCMP deaminase
MSRLFPCNECAKAIIQVGIKEIVFLDDKYHDHLESQASRRILDMAGVSYRKYVGRKVDIRVEE